MAGICRSVQLRLSRTRTEFSPIRTLSLQARVHGAPPPQHHCRRREETRPSISWRPLGIPVAPLLRMPKRLAILTSGGDSAGMNPAVKCAVDDATQRRYDTHLISDGLRGLIADRIVVTTREQVSGMLHSRSSATSNAAACPPCSTPHCCGWRARWRRESSHFPCAVCKIADQADQAQPLPPQRLRGAGKYRDA